MTMRSATAADAMVNERMGSFRSWLVDQVDRDDAVGVLACEVRADRCLGQKRTPAAVLTHILAVHRPAAGVPEAFNQALAEWRR